MNSAYIMKRNVQLGQLKRTLRRRSFDLAAFNRQLKHEIARRKLAEECLRKSE